MICCGFICRPSRKLWSAPGFPGVDDELFIRSVRLYLLHATLPAEGEEPDTQPQHYLKHRYYLSLSMSGWHQIGRILSKRVKFPKEQGWNIGHMLPVSIKA
ncbi:hypothetical protein OCU04_009343 [Sclerotinia nivalis]|uniref:Uncharacterized protein n=1 Tax=Sclerotinia nivalis TaxID=352851 RepID=A0A9X0AEU7_9HELO|nr:hypothetical protein OCU04_009343 [Sclerotinia nivalis]